MIVITQRKAPTCTGYRLICVVLLILTAQQYLGAQAARPCARSNRFSDCYALRDSIVLFQDAKNPIVRLSAVSLTPKGEIIVADASEAQVKVFAANGSLIKILGGKGGGPGEFYEPRVLSVTSSGWLHVLDPRAMRITIFNDRLKLVRTFLLPRASAYVTSMAIDSLGRYVLGGMGPEGVIVLSIDSTGKLLKEYLRGPRATRGADKMWRVLLAVNLSASRDSIYLVSTVQDSLYTLGLEQAGRISSRQIPVPDRSTRPSPPDVFDRQTFARWADSFFRPDQVFPDGREVVVSLVKGNPFDGLTSVLAVLKAGEWSMLAGAPRVVFLDGNRLLAILDPGPERVVLGLFRRK